ncbi:MAG TPA: DUF3108 domain-containing protein [Thermoanaerobaculia bacterium]|jgi:hypothetical protein
MTHFQRTMAALALTCAVAGSAAAEETLRYNWRLRGALSWIARAKFPTSGTGVLQTSPRGGAVDSQLRVNAGGKDYIEYRSRMDESARRTLTSVNGYSFGDRSERKETVYDYNANVARVAEREQGQVGNKTRPLPVDEARDVLTTIAYLREHASTLTAPLTTDVFADGKPYRVTIKPEGLKTAEWQGRQVPARVFRVVAAPGAQKKFPGLTVWLSDDAQHLPLRIVIDQQYASLDLRLRPS